MRTTERLQYARKEFYAKSNRMFILLLFCLLILVAGAMFLNSQYFSLGSVEIKGNKYMSIEDINNIAGIPQNVNIFRLKTSEIKNKLMCDLRIENVAVSRRFPATIIINVIERRPIAYMTTNYGFVEVDKQGIVLAAFKNLKDIKVPIITGITLGSVYVGDKAEAPELDKVLQYLEHLDEFSINELSEININSSGHLTVYTLHSGYIRLGSASNLLQKAKLTNSILSEVIEKKFAVEYIDLTFASPYIKFKQ